MQVLKKFKHSGITGLILFSSQLSWAVDLLPNDVVAPPPGIQQLQINYQRSERSDYYLNNRKASTGGEIVNTQTQLKYGRSFELSNLPAYFYVQAPLTEISTTGSVASYATNSGVGDTTFALALWPYANREADRYVGIASYLTVPTGTYHSEQKLNAGDNRYKWALQVGYEQPIYKNTNWMSAIDAVWFGDNDDHATTHKKLEQKALYSAQTAFIYKFN